ncbi:MAG: hypothetical protein O3C59_07220, partial [Proteobacteria bacterium]|nr:hypothetical protein [Pseudomonadota bacterium]
GRGNWADQTAKPLFPCPAAVFFSAAGRPVLLLSFCLNPNPVHAHDGGARNRRMAASLSC